jgi:hypothetical protein
MIVERTFYKDQTAPPTLLQWLDRAGPLDASAFTDWRLEFVDEFGVDRLHKTAGIAGGDGTDLANIIVSWATGDLTDTPEGIYRVRLSAVGPAGRRYMPGPPIVVEVIDAATVPTP